MFKVKVPGDEDAEILRKAVYEFVLDSNEEMNKEDNPVAKKFDGLKKKLGGRGGKHIDKLKEKVEGMRFSVEEVYEDDDKQEKIVAFKIINPITAAIEDIPVAGGALGVSLKGFMRQSMAALRDSLDAMKYCEECDSIRDEEDECSECGSETYDFDFKVR